MTSARTLRRDDDGSTITGGLVKTAIALALVGLVGLDGVALAQAQFGAADDASTAANAAADAFHSTHSKAQALHAAQASLTKPGEVVVPKTMVINGRGDVTLTVRRTAKTIWMKRVPDLKDHLTAVSVGSGIPPSS